MLAIDRLDMIMIKFVMVVGIEKKRGILNVDDARTETIVEKKTLGKIAIS